MNSLLVQTDRHYYNDALPEGGQAGVDGGRELKKLRVSPGLSDATRGIGGQRSLARGGAEQQRGPGLWRYRAQTLRSGAEWIWARPTRVCGPPSSGDWREWIICGARAWRGLLARACLQGAPPRRRCPIGGEEKPKKLVGAWLEVPASRMEHSGAAGEGRAC
ncbi:hypothetical protein NDU88_005425 [Pleurodeles waltl]|uniref:Uncharacterized protein n=1 Tax=Pleurodeles waltl TaxID=8319 RepID=A0AAV7MCU8_PLEWA|nr:hypothetical protein NDU88_005425 [Pleurodeles waltl]